MSVKLSACIVAYNNYEDIKVAITSMEQFTSPELPKRIYIVDNGVAISSPSDVEKFKEFIEKCNDVEYIDAGSNLGFGKGHNTVLDRLDSEYHAIVNPDILFCEDAFSRIISWMDENKDVGMVIPDIRDEFDKTEFSTNLYLDSNIGYFPALNKGLKNIDLDLFEYVIICQLDESYSLKAIYELSY